MDQDRPATLPVTLNEALERAVRALDAQRPDEAERLALIVLKAHRGNVHAAHLLATAMLMQGRPGEAVTVLEPFARKGADAGLNILLSRALAQAGRRDDALEALRRACAWRPVHPPAFLELGAGLTDLGRLDEALAVYEAGLELAPGDQNLRIGLGYLRLQQVDGGAASLCFGQVLQEAPARPDAMVGLARAKAMVGEHTEAVALYSQALALRPAMTALKVDLAKSLLELNRREEAEALLRTVAKGGAAAPATILGALADASHGRLFLRPSGAVRFFQA
jgi:tetratricopeptide (TPR) repeat protein